MKTATRAQVKRVMEECVAEQTSKIAPWTNRDLRQAYPFHRLFFTNEGVATARAERSIVTSMGASLYPRLAMAVARDMFEDVRLEHRIDGDVNTNACNLLDQIVTELRAPRRGRQNPRTPNRNAELNDIVVTRDGDPDA